MTRHNANKLATAIFVIVLAVFATACSTASSPTGPTTPIQPETIASLASLSPAARALAADATSRTMIIRFADRKVDNPIRVYIGQFSPADVARALTVWENAAIPNFHFVQVTNESDGEIDLFKQMPPSGVCGDGAPTLQVPLIVGGTVRVGLGLIPGCPIQGNDSMVGVIGHEIGHTLGFGHSPADTDIMSPNPANLTLSAPLIELARWIYSQPVGATIQ